MHGVKLLRNKASWPRNPISPRRQRVPGTSQTRWWLASYVQLAANRSALAQGGRLRLPRFRRGTMRIFCMLTDMALGLALLGDAVIAQTTPQEPSPPPGATSGGASRPATVPAEVHLNLIDQKLALSLAVDTQAQIDMGQF